MNNFDDHTKLYLKLGERGQLLAEPSVPMRENSIVWRANNGNVVITDQASQVTPYDIEIVPTGIGMAIVEFQAISLDGVKLIHVYEISVGESLPGNMVVGHARAKRKSSRIAPTPLSMFNVPDVFTAPELEQPDLPVSEPDTSGITNVGQTDDSK